MRVHGFTFASLLVGLVALAGCDPFNIVDVTVTVPQEVQAALADDYPMALVVHAGEDSERLEFLCEPGDTFEESARIVSDIETCPVETEVVAWLTPVTLADLAGEPGQGEAEACGGLFRSEDNPIPAAPDDHEAQASAVAFLSAGDACPDLNDAVTLTLALP